MSKYVQLVFLQNNIISIETILKYKNNKNHIKRKKVNKKNKKQKRKKQKNMFKKSSAPVL
jgi:uncharacterized membrane protein YgaE (UPF0421/DUF939 family)